MRIALLDVDSKTPNLALMRLSAYHKRRGDSVEWYKPLWIDTYDQIYAAKIFDFSDDSLLIPERMTIGGTGWNLSVVLPEEVEVEAPDYELYGYPHSIGFTARGCRFRCKFCVVPEKEGRPLSTSTIEEIWTNRGSDFVVLLDNDFFGGPDWSARIEEIKDRRLRVNFSQGLNIRLITDEQCAALKAVRFRTLSGKRDQVNFAWDRIDDERRILDGIDRVIGAGISPRQMGFFVLVGFNSTPAEDLHRVEMLRDRGCNPFVMPYDKTDAYQRRFARWVNHKAIFASVSWAEFGGLAA